MIFLQVCPIFEEKVLRHRRITDAISVQKCCAQVGWYRSEQTFSFTLIIRYTDFRYFGFMFIVKLEVLIITVVNNGYEQKFSSVS